MHDHECCMFCPEDQDCRDDAQALIYRLPGIEGSYYLAACPEHRTEAVAHVTDCGGTDATWR